MEGNIDLELVFVVDSSFLLSILLPDEKVLKPFQKYIKNFRKNRTVFKSCELLKYEIGNSLKSAVIQKRIDTKKAKELYLVFEQMTIDYQNIDHGEVLKLSMKHNLSFYDASYLYLTRIHKCKLLTLDKKLKEIVS